MSELVQEPSDRPSMIDGDQLPARHRPRAAQERSDNRILLRVIQTLIGWEWPMRLLNPLLRDYNPFLPEFRADPYPTLGDTDRVRTRNSRGTCHGKFLHRAPGQLNDATRSRLPRRRSEMWSTSNAATCVTHVDAGAASMACRYALSSDQS